ncbi:hypothetical protein PLUTE_a0982 [Pseudoalteromonas luteoviolacea DSM 6061]|nr:hypothetical protein [Pseudoalteromonas luteoviolacea DSM 6061]MBE0387787.1 hypothetical protein [Pseudoalteromonas luteoviolacea DSM 6061]MBE0387788.1 hypothetical protein [Pseudoalteromonas luteoviolacea DSM 6061]MBE0388016.1 hypothetical protein [Pseudoalteromonas luteoviolacea DSM 6061]MBE0388095.1 hypothetical protein [Pseudoalteromonas luteoviolacea DSM 6061]
MESETIHFPIPAFQVQRVNDSERSEFVSFAQGEINYFNN